MISTVQIQFDGGCHPNPGRMYGSYAITWDGQELFSTTQDYEHGTSNVAEFTALYRGILKTLDLCEVSMVLPRTVQVEILSDSTVVINRINNPWKPYSGDNQGRHRMTDWSHRCHSLLERFASFKARKIDRELNMSKFGH